jgi:hypothetical protein
MRVKKTRKKLVKSLINIDQERILVIARVEAQDPTLRPTKIRQRIPKIRQRIPGKTDKNQKTQVNNNPKIRKT